MGVRANWDSNWDSRDGRSADISYVATQDANGNCGGGCIVRLNNGQTYRVRAGYGVMSRDLAEYMLLTRILAIDATMMHFKYIRLRGGQEPVYNQVILNKLTPPPLRPYRDEIQAMIRDGRFIRVAFDIRSQADNVEAVEAANEAVQLEEGVFEFKEIEQ